MNIDLTGKNAFVSGGSQGIGRAVAEELARLGANVTIAARTETSLIDAVVGLNMSSSPFQQHDYIVADYSEPEKLKSALNRHTKKHILLDLPDNPPSHTDTVNKFAQVRI